MIAWQVTGFVFIVMIGIPLHSGFAWFGQAPAIAWLTPVNESTWEHLKLAFWPAVVYGTVEYVVFGKDVAGFGLAKSVGILAMPLGIVTLKDLVEPITGELMSW